MTQCSNNDAAAAIYLPGDATPARGCMDGELFQRMTASNEALPYGTSLEVNGNTCTAQESGISCHPTGSNGGFTISREGIRAPEDVGGTDGPRRMIVDPAAFSGTNPSGSVGTYFQTPSGKFVCGSNDDGRVAGCNALVEVAGKTCPAQKVVQAGWSSANLGVVSGLCADDTVFSLGSSDGQSLNRVLPYGSMIVVDDVVFTVDPGGVRAFHLFVTDSFTLSTEGLAFN